MKQALTVCGYSVLLRWEENPTAIVYLPGDAADGETVFSLLAGSSRKTGLPTPALAVLTGLDWNRELSPWPGQKAFRSGADFAGGADAFLSRLTGELIPAVENALGTALPQTRVLAGYSMAGLFALYAMYRTDVFQRFASMSGSLWYDGFLDYMAATPLARLPERVSLSLGDREAQTKNARLAKVETCTKAAAALLTQAGVPVSLTMEPGGHFTDIPRRTAEGILSALRNGPVTKEQKKRKEERKPCT